MVILDWWMSFSMRWSKTYATLHHVMPASSNLIWNTSPIPPSEQVPGAYSYSTSTQSPTLMAWCVPNSLPNVGFNLCTIAFRDATDFERYSQFNRAKSSRCFSSKRAAFTSLLRVALTFVFIRLLTASKLSSSIPSIVWRATDLGLVRSMHCGNDRLLLTSFFFLGQTFFYMRGDTLLFKVKLLKADRIKQTKDLPSSYALRHLLNKCYRLAAWIFCLSLAPSSF